MRSKTTIRKECGISDFRLAESEDCESLLTVSGQTAYMVDVFITVLFHPS